MQKLVALASAIKALFTKTTVDSLIADVEQRAAHLTVVAGAKALEQRIHQDEIDARTALKVAAQKEETRARAIAAKFRALISAV